jgi:SAM-dependent methyltransferase
MSTLLAKPARRRTPARIVELDQRLYPGLDGHWDDLLLREAVLDELRPQHRLLDLGAGAGIVAAMNFRGRCATVAGVDPDPRVLLNPHLDEPRIGSGEELPWPAASFHLVVADNVLEHLAEPAAVLAEVRRVLRPGGLFLAKTPNRWHYMPLIARLTPTWFHRWVNRLRGRAEIDTFPTRYRANDARSLRALAAATGLVLEQVGYHEMRPEYLRMHPWLYRIGWLWERCVNRYALLRPLRIVLVVRLRRPRVSPSAP